MRGSQVNKAVITKVKDDSAIRQESLLELQGKLYAGEEIRWTGTPNSALYLTDLAYKGVMWWSVFAFIVPIVPGGNSIELTALLVLMLSWLEFKKDWNTRVYYVTDTRAILAQKNRRKEWIFTDHALTDLVAMKQGPVMKSIRMKFRTANGVKNLRFVYVADGAVAMACLNRQPLPLTDTAPAESAV